MPTCLRPDMCPKSEAGRLHSAHLRYLRTQMSSYMPNDVDVVIIGAGAAGIAAACHLQERDVSILLLEASPRLGGRAWTVEAGKHALELGCGWLHSAERNPWMHLAKFQGLETAAMRHGVASILTSVSRSMINARHWQH